MEYGKERLVELLLTMDEEATLLLGTDGRRFPVVIVGGSAFLLHDLTNRPTTHDVDVLSCHAALRGVLANDPRPRYQRDPERVYTLSFAGFEVSFTVRDETLTVTAVRAGGERLRD